MSTEELLEDYNKLQRNIAEMRDTIKVRLAEEKAEREENCADDSSLDNFSNAKANNNIIPENNDDTLYYITKSRVGRSKFDSTGSLL